MIMIHSVGHLLKLPRYQSHMEIRQYKSPIDCVFVITVPFHESEQDAAEFRCWFEGCFQVFESFSSFLEKSGLHSQSSGRLVTQDLDSRVAPGHQRSWSLSSSLN